MTNQKQKAASRGFLHFRQKIRTQLVNWDSCQEALFLNIFEFSIFFSYFYKYSKL